MQHDPTLAPGLGNEGHAIGAIGGQDAGNIPHQQAGQDEIPVARQNAAEARRERPQGAGEDIRQHEIIGAGGGNGAMAQAGRDRKAQIATRLIGAGIFFGHGHGDGIDIGRDHGAVQNPCGGDGENAGAGAEIEHPARAAALQDMIEAGKAAMGRAMVAGAKRQCSLDFDGDAVCVPASRRTVMRAMNHEPAGLDRLQSIETGGDPIARRDLVKLCCRSHLCAGDGGDQFAHRVLIGRVGEIDFRVPALGGLILKAGDAGFIGVKQFTSQFSDGFRGIAGGGDADDGGYGRGDEAFTHGAGPSTVARQRHLISSTRRTIAPAPGMRAPAHRAEETPLKNATGYSTFGATQMRCFCMAEACRLWPIRNRRAWSMLRRLSQSSKLPALALLGAALTLTVVTAADAAPKGSMGSRGSRTNVAPPPTATAPTQARPMERSVTQPGAPSATAARPGAPAAQAAQPSFARNLMTGVAAGLLGAGLFGLLSGSGLFSGLGSLSGFFGLLLQIGLIYLAYRLIRGFLARRNQPAMAGGRAMQRMTQPQAAPHMARTGMMAGAGLATAAPAVDITPQDFTTFQNALATIQTAYGREDVPALRANLTPEMAAYFEEELDNNRRKGVLNRTGRVELLQGDLSEAWADPDAEYATVAMRYAMADAMVERGTGRVVEGDLNNPQQFTEVWTFRREPRQAWKLSAIQQVQ